jgi:hypothetical protein
MNHELIKNVVGLLCCVIVVCNIITLINVLKLYKENKTLKKIIKCQVIAFNPEMPIPDKIVIDGKVVDLDNNDD